jgi:hypothetical protein
MSADAPKPAWAQRLVELRRARQWVASDVAREMKKLRSDLPGTNSLTNMIRGDWEGGRYCPGPRYRLLLAAVYDIDEAELFPHVAVVSRKPAGSVKKTGTVEGWDDMERRALLRLLTALGAGAAVPFDAMETLRSGLNSQLDKLDMSVDEWERTAWEYGHALVTRPPAQLVAELAVDVTQVRRALAGTHAPATVTGLQRTSAQLAASTAMSLHDMGDLRSAWRWWATARHAADASGDRDLAVWMRAREAHNSRYGMIRLPQIVTALNDEAVTLAAGRPSAGLATALSTRAILAAQSGDHSSAITALQELETLYEQLPASVTDDALTQWGWSEPNLRQVEGGTYARLGNTIKARAALDRATALWPPDRHGAWTQIKLRQSLCDVSDGDVTHGLDTAVTTLTALPPEQRPTFIDFAARDVLAALPEGKARQLPAAQELRALTSSV